MNEPAKTVIASARDLAAALLEQAPVIGLALIVLLAAWLGARATSAILTRILTRSRARPALIEIAQNLVSLAFWLSGILIAVVLVFPTITPARLLTAFGLGSIAVGFAFKDIFENFVAGILILFREPFRLQDFIECQEIEGFVEQITIRDTRLRRTDGQLVVIPNAQLFTNPVTVRTDQDVRRTTIICGVAYGEDVDQARDVIRKSVEGLATIDAEHPVEIFAQAFGSSSIDFEVTWWTGSKPLDIRRSRDEVVAAVKRGLDEAGIEIPFPYRTLTFKHPLAIRQGGEDAPD